MKIVITKSQRIKVFEDYVKRLLENPELYFIDHIDVEERMTDYTMIKNIPLITVTFFFKHGLNLDEDSDTISESFDELKEKVKTAFNMLYPPEEPEGFGIGMGNMTALITLKDEWL